MITAQSVAVEDYYSRFTGEEIDSILAKVNPHIGDTIIHVTVAEKTAWNGKQPTIEDLATIRSNASLGATAYGWGNHALAGYLTEHQSLAAYATKDWVWQRGYVTQSWVENKGYITSSALSPYALKTDIPTTLPASDVYAWAKASSKPSYSTTEVSEGTNKYFTDARAQSALSGHTGDTTIHITSAERTAWNAKQGAISDLATIRSNASLGATAYGWGNHANAGYYVGTADTIKAIKVDNATNADNANACSGNAASATKLQTSRKLWGQSFDGTSNVQGSLTFYAGEYIDGAANIHILSGGEHNWNVFSGESTRLFCIKNSGSVGINRYPDDSYKLDVNGSVRIGSAVLEYDSTNNALKVTGANGATMNLYSTGGLSAYGFNGDGGLENINFTDLYDIKNLSNKSSNVGHAWEYKGSNTWGFSDYAVKVGPSLPSSPDSKTIYIITS